MGACIQQTCCDNLMVEGQKVYLKNLSKKTVALYNRYKVNYPILFCPCLVKKFLPLVITSVEDDIAILNLEGTTGYTIAYLKDLGIRD